MNSLKKPWIVKTFQLLTFTKNVNQISKNLYLGNILSSQDNDFLEKNNIKAIVNCTEKEPFHKYFDKKDKLRIDVEDNLTEENKNKFYSKFDEAVDFIDYNIKNNKPVLVHCYWGLMRSATIVSAYLIRKSDMEIDTIIEHIRRTRPYSLNANYNFIDLLEKYKNNLVKMEKKSKCKE